MSAADALTDRDLDDLRMVERAQRRHDDDFDVSWDGPRDFGECWARMRSLASRGYLIAVMSGVYRLSDAGRAALACEGTR